MSAAKKLSILLVSVPSSIWVDLAMVHTLEDPQPDEVVVRSMFVGGQHRVRRDVVSHGGPRGLWVFGGNDKGDRAVRPERPSAVCDQ